LFNFFWSKGFAITFAKSYLFFKYKISDKSVHQFSPHISIASLIFFIKLGSFNNFSGKYKSIFTSLIVLWFIFTKDSTHGMIFNQNHFHIFIALPLEYASILDLSVIDK
jgi:hypothetical protein